MSKTLILDLWQNRCLWIEKLGILFQGVHLGESLKYWYVIDDALRIGDEKNIMDSWSLMDIIDVVSRILANWKSKVNPFKLKWKMTFITAWTSDMSNTFPGAAKIFRIVVIIH